MVTIRKYSNWVFPKLGKIQVSSNATNIIYVNVLLKFHEIGNCLENILSIIPPLPIPLSPLKEQNNECKYV